VALVALGSMVGPALEAAERLRAAGIEAAVLNARFAKPLDRTWLVDLARRCGRMLVIEEHARPGGFGEAVAALLCEAGVAPRLQRLAVPDDLIEHGNPDQWLADLGLDAAGIERAARELLVD
jgi:1-deoxy-D-xylulose-5-phosphate synthase